MELGKRKPEIDGCGCSSAASLQMEGWARLMKRAAIIAADFSPSSLPPALRVRFFANHLADFGWQATIITTKPEYYDWPVDSRNNDLLAACLDVVRTSAMPVTQARHLGFSCVGFRSL